MLTKKELQFFRFVSCTAIEYVLFVSPYFHSSRIYLFLFSNNLAGLCFLPSVFRCPCALQCRYAAARSTTRPISFKTSLPFCSTLVYPWSPPAEARNPHAICYLLYSSMGLTLDRGLMVFYFRAILLFSLGKGFTGGPLWG